MAGLNMKKDILNTEMGVSMSLIMVPNFFGRGCGGKTGNNRTEVRIQKRHKA